MRTVSPPHYSFIDALRGLAILGVIIVHAAQSFKTLPPWLGRVIPHGQTGVQLFFVVSAFTLFLSLELRKGKEEHPVRNFFIRRLFRIAPMFWFGILLYMLVPTEHRQRWAPGGLEWWHLLTTFTFTHGWHPMSITSVVPGGWSIAVEMTFYLLVPALFFMVRRLRVALVLFVIAVPLVELINAQVWVRGLSTYFPQFPYLSKWFLYLWFPNQLPVFLLGIVLFFLSRGRFALWLKSRPVAAGGLLAGCVMTLIALTQVSIPYAFPYSRWGSGIPFVHIVFSIVFVPLAISLMAWPNRLFVNGFTRYLGTISFSGYIMHFAVIELMVYLLKLIGIWSFTGTVTRYTLFLLLVLAGTMLVSSVTYRLVEVPGQRMGRRLIEKWNGNKPRQAGFPEEG